MGCGSEKQRSSGTTVNNTSTTAAPTAEEIEMNKIRLEQYKEYAPSQTQMYNNAFGLGNQLLTSFGDKNSSGWQSLIGGVNQNQMNAQANQAVNVSNAALNQAGIVDSGAGQVARARAAADSYNSNAQFNVGAMQNALNLALSGQAQVQSPASSNTNSLASSLAGLRSTNTTGTTSTTGWKGQTGMNLGFLGSWGGSY